MSIGIAMISSQGIVLAADSKTELPNGSKRFDLPKIIEIKCGEFHCAIIKAGKTDLTSEIIYRVERDCLEKQPIVVSDIRDIFYKSAHEVQREIASLNSPAASDLVMNPVELIVAVWDKETPRLYELRFPFCYLQDRQQYAVIGSGHLEATMAIDGLSPTTKNIYPVIYAAVYAVESAKAWNSSCEGETQCAVLNRAGFLRMPTSFIGRTSELCNRFQDENRRKWTQTLSTWVYEEANKNKVADSSLAITRSPDNREKS